MTSLKSSFLLYPDKPGSSMERRKASRADRHLSALLSLLAFICTVLLGLVLVFLAKESWPVVRGGSWLAFFQDPSWYPLEGLFGITPMIWGSLAIASGTIALALPIGLASAIFVQFFAPRSIVGIYRHLLSLLAGIPSVVYGLWGLTELVPLIAAWRPPGASLLAAVVVLTLMVLPTIALTSAAALAAVPEEITAGALALGLCRKTQIVAVTIPSAKAGIISGTLLATARALGETMAVLMVAGNVVQNPSGLFEPVRALTANIALEMAYATGDHRAGLFASGLFLTLLVLLLSALASRAFSARQEQGYG